MKEAKNLHDGHFGLHHCQVLKQVYNEDMHEKRNEIIFTVVLINSENHKKLLLSCTKGSYVEEIIGKKLTYMLEVTMYK